jgi:hypothetical protein
MANFTNSVLATMCLETMSPLSYSPELASSDFHFFGPMKLHIVRQKFQNDHELKRYVLNGLRSQDKNVMLLASVACQDNGCVCAHKRRIS